MTTYSERQRGGPWWVWALVAVSVVGAWIGGIAIWSSGQSGADAGATVLVVVIGILVPIGFVTIHLDIAVDAEAVRVRYFPFVRRSIPLTDIARVEARHYAPVREYGGWGIKGWSRRKIAYNLRGDEGVDLTLVDGRRVLLGTQRPLELAAAITAARGDVAGPGGAQSPS